ncbi:MAG: D-glycero-alpha-D-manno-heptose-1,7-bisphosphate 7-phosphatase [Flavobacteriales bacterium]
MCKIIPKIDYSWTLFLDRDGVINKKIEGDYVKSVNEFEFLPKALDSIVKFSRLFHRIIIVTNQQGISKKLMTEDDLNAIHKHLKKSIQKQNGKIDAIYFAPQLATANSYMRKPNIGMALQAREDFPSIDFKKSIMIGDSISDMEFADKAGMKGFFIGNSPKYTSVNSLYNAYQILKH